MIRVQMAQEHLVEIVVRNLQSRNPLIRSRSNIENELVPFPSSSNQQDAACLGRAVGIPVPQAIKRISSGPRSSLWERRNRGLAL